MAQDNDQNMEGHEYDGIRELDNPLPTWWLITFLGAIAFSFFYLFHFHLTPENLIVDEFERDKKAVSDLQAQVIPEALPPAADLSAIAALPENVLLGKKHFAMLCASCHGASGEGGIGPNLTDAFWLHGRGEISDMVVTIRDGVIDKGMPAWSTVIKMQEIYETAAYINSLQGSQPANAKKPQGQEIK